MGEFDYVVGGGSADTLTPMPKFHCRAASAYF
jgi:hypothetical protein